jgi:hypothetical protein
MPIQSAVRTQLVYKAETTFGTAAGASGGQSLRRVSSSLGLKKDAFTSNEVRSDMQVADVRHGGKSVRGAVEGELSVQTYDDWLAAVVRGAWVAGVSAAPADFATGVTPSNAGTFTFAGAGSLITKGFKVGDIVRCTGITGNNNINYRITALTATVMTVTPNPVTNAQVAAGWTVSVVGSKVLPGVLTPSYTIEHSHLDLDISEQFLGCRIGGVNINLPPNGIGTISWDVMGRDGVILTGASSPYFTAPASETTTGVLTGIEGGLRMNGVEQAIVTGLQLNISNNLSVQPVIGTPLVPDIFYGRTVITGTVSAFLADEQLINAFINESNIDLVAVASASGAAPQAFLCFNMQNVKLTGYDKTVQAEGGVIVQFTFQSIVKAGGTGTIYDQGSLSIQRSN